MTAMRRHLPLFIALSASSPFNAGGRLACAACACPPNCGAPPPAVKASASASAKMPIRILCVI